MHRKTRLKLTDLNPLLTCSLCKGYLIDATTLTECLHSFCRSCLVRYLQTSKQCPKCDTMVHKTRPLHNASSSRSARSPGNLGVDRALQNIVYKLVPGLFRDEMKKRRDFYMEHPQAGTSASTAPGDLEARGEVGEEALVIYSDDENMNLSLEYFLPFNSRKRTADSKESEEEPAAKRAKGDLGEDDDIVHKRYLRCPAGVCVKHIKKFIRNKFDLKPVYQVEITHVDNEDDSLPDDYTLMDVAYIYAWRRNGPLPLVFRVFKESPKRQKTGDVTDKLPQERATESAEPTLNADNEQTKNTNDGPLTDKNHSNSPTPPPPTLVKESDVASKGKTVEPLKKTEVHKKSNAVSVKDNSTETTNGRKLAANGGENHVKGSVVENSTDSQAKLDNSSSNNNEKTEVIKDAGRAKDKLSSLVLKSNNPAMDLPPTLATVGLVPAR